MANNNPIFRSLEFIENQISEKLTVKNIADNIYFSKHHYSRLFHEIVGDSVMRYVSRRKLTLAGKALLETDANIIDIAMDYGYNSREGFSRSFKAYMGVSPTEYRKYGLTYIKQNIIKERSSMAYSKITDEIVRELNGFIVIARETADHARKCDVQPYKAFWEHIASRTDDLADRLKFALERISIIAERSDEITARLAIIKTLENINFESSLMCFNIKLMISRGKAEHIEYQMPLCRKFEELAYAAGGKTEKIVQYFNELAALIFKDMKKAAAGKIEEVICKGRSAADNINGYPCIKEEVTSRVKELSIPIGEITETLLEDCLFKLDIIIFAADMEIFRSGGADKEMFDGLKSFNESLSDAIEFFRSLSNIPSIPEISENNPVLERTIRKRSADIAYQGNIMLFYTKSEIEKLTGVRSSSESLLNDKQKADFNEICGMMDDFIRFSYNADNEAAYKELKIMATNIYHALDRQADILNSYGGAVRFLGNEFKFLADNLTGIKL
ncbi:MAG: AraC family transcriptional regulator [Oscillospiraceae bacterium]|nr:AraC family transcriptional regulator [Oscillospiraceae bacterium]